VPFMPMEAPFDEISSLISSKGASIVPFMPMEAPFDEIKELIANIHEWWSEAGKNRERVGELMLRLGMRAFFKGVGLEPVAQTVRTPRANPFFFWHAEDFEAEAAGRKYIKL